MTPQAVFLGGCFILIALIAAGVASSIRAGRAGGPAPGAAGDRPRGGASPRATVLIVAAVVAVVAVQWMSSRPARAPQAGGSGLWLLAIAPTAFVFLFLAALLAGGDRVAGRARRLEAAGDLDGAIAILRESIDRGRPSAGRSSALGLLYSRAGDFEGAIAMMDRAESIGGRAPLDSINRADTLRKMGRPAEALTALSGPRGRGIVGLVGACHAACALVDLGRLNEARASIAEAEAVLARGLPGRFRGVGESEIRTCRDRLAAAEAAPPGGPSSPSSS